MKREEIIRLARHHLNDLDGAVFSDKELDRFLESVLREYFLQTASARGEAPILLEDGAFFLPENLLGVLRGWDRNGMNLRLGTSEEVPGLSSRRGEIETLYEDLSDDGALRVFPEVEQSAWRNIQDEEDTTTPFADGRGVITQMNGIACGYGYGVNTDLLFFEDIGSIQYVRFGEVSEVQDHLALVYGVCAKALNTDADLASPNNAAFYQNLYRQRVGGRQIVTRGDAHAPRRGEYF